MQHNSYDPSEIAREVFEQYRDYINPPLARLMKLSGAPVEMTAQGTTIHDQAGRTYLDFAGGYGVFTLGHRHPRVIAAVAEQLQRMPMSGRTMFNPLMGKLAERLAHITPGDLAISFFANSGAEAIEGALKLARKATGRTKIVATHNAYHGKTFGALSASGRQPFREPFQPLMPDFVHVPFGDIDALRAEVEDAAAVIMEPIQAEGGVILPPPGYLSAVSEVCRNAGTLFLLDEVQTGLGRCGVRFVCEIEGVVPDVLMLAKGLSGGVIPIGAYIARRDVWNAAYKRDPLLHTSTFGGNELACAAALAALDVLEDEQLANAAKERGAQLLAGVRRVTMQFPGIIAEARGLGLLVGVELREEGYAGTILSAMLKRGITIAWTLNCQRVLRLEPPLIITAEEIDIAVAALEASVLAARPPGAASSVSSESN